MSGHSKWATTKHKKAATDAVRGKVFAKYARLIMLESRKAAGDISSPGLASVIARAKSENVPKDNIDRAVAKGTSADADSLEQVTYECYGPAGVAVIIDALTDSRNRTTQEIKHLLSKQGIEMSTPGSSAWAFTREPDGAYTPNEGTMLDVAGDDEEKLSNLLTVLDEHDDVQTVFTNARGYETTNTSEEDA